eukprot:5300217-Ditylum_brightwellii.AAC.2
MNGQSNVSYTEVLFNFFIAIAASSNTKACEFISGNLFRMTFQHAQKCIAYLSTMSFIYLECEQMVQLILDCFNQICTLSRLDSMAIVFSNTINATVLIKAFQYSSNSEFIMGGVSQSLYECLGLDKRRYSEKY